MNFFKNNLFNLIFFIGLLTVINSCKSYEKKIQTKKLPEIQPYNESLTVYDNNEIINNLKDLENLSYNTTYTMYHTGTDSLEKNMLRYKIATQTREFIKNSFENILLLDDSIFLRNTYKEIMSNSAEIKQKKNYQKIEHLTVNDSNSKQLFIEIIVYPKENSFKNLVTFFVFNSHKNELLYYHPYNFMGDIRDNQLREKIVSYGLLKLATEVSQ